MNPTAVLEGQTSGFELFSLLRQWVEKVGKGNLRFLCLKFEAHTGIWAAGGGGGGGGVTE